MPESSERQKCKKIFMKALRKTPNPADSSYRPTDQQQQWWPRSEPRVAVGGSFRGRDARKHTF
jgi:hypothetical protein